MNKKTICIGNALVDKICMLENDDMLSSENLPKGSMQIISQDDSIRLQEATSNLKSEISTGGSAANTANGLANLNIETAYIGMVGKDQRQKSIYIKYTFIKTNCGRWFRFAIF